MTTNNHSAITTGAAANAATINNPLGQLDAAIGNLTTLGTTPKTSVVGALGTAAPTTTAQTIVGAINELVTSIAALAVSASNVVWDPFNNYTTANTDWGGKARWLAGANLGIVTDASNPYGARTLRLTGTTASGKKIYLNEIGAKETDTLIFGVYFKALETTTFTVSCRFFDSGGSLIGSSFAGAGAARTSGDLATQYSGLATVPSGAAGIAIWLKPSAGASATADMYAWWGVKNLANAGATPLPSPAETEFYEEIIEARGGYADLDARLDTVEGNNLDYYGRQFLRNWQAEVAKINYGSATGQPIVAIVGDSWVERAGIPTYIRTLLQTEYGDAGLGWVGARATSVDLASDFTTAGTWTYVDSDDATAKGPDFYHANSTDTATPAKKTWTKEANAFVIHWYRQTGGGTFRYQVDAGGWTSVDTNGAAGYQTTTISGLDGNSHLLTIEVTVAGAAGVTLLGVDIQLTAEGVRVHRIGNSGLRLAEAAAVDATNWEAALTALGVDVVIFLAGTNDQRDDTAPSVAAGYLNTLIDRVQAAVALADNVVIMFGPNGETHTYETSEYVSEFRDVCVAQGAAWLDLHANIGTYAAGNSRGLYDDAIHLNNTGAYLVANLLYNRLLATR